MLLLGAAAPVHGQSVALPSQAGTSVRLADLRRRIEGDNRNHPVASVQWAEQALGLPDLDKASEIWLLRGLVRDLRVLGEPDRATLYLERGRRLVQAAGTERDHDLLELEAADLANTREAWATALATLQGLLPSMEAYGRAHPGDGEVLRGLERSYRLEGTVHRNLGQYPQAIDALQKGQRLCETTGDHREHARILSQMGTLYAILGRFDEAVASHRSAIALAESLGDLELQATCHFSLANAYGYRNDTDRQLEELTIASNLAGRTGNATLRLNAAVNLSDVYLRRKEYRAARTQAQATLAMAHQANNQTAIAVSQVNLGIALNRLGDSEGIKSILAGLEHFSSSQAMGDVVEITGALAEEYAFAGDYRKAYDTEVQFKALADALQGSQDRKRVAEASAAFESDKKQIQIEALQRDHRYQIRLRLLGMIVGLIGCSAAGGMVVSRKKLEKANRSLADMSLRDPLTSLANRRYLTTRIAEDLAQVHRLQRARLSDKAAARIPLNIDIIFLMIDVDHFKQVNDQFGHGAGDSLLKQIAGILSQTMRDSDTVVRWGGEEFLVVAKHSSRQDAHLVAERIRSRVEAEAFDLGNGQVIHKTCSVGFASYPFYRQDPGKVSWEKVAELADQCLFAAKSMGRNTWVGVREADAQPETSQEGFDTFPRASALVRDGVLVAEAREARDIPWPV